MKNSKQKPTLFDILAIAVPGFITLYLIFVGLLDGDISKFGVAEYVCAFAASCLVGMVIHWISKPAFEGFMRNRYEDIKAARDEFMKGLGKGENEGKANIDEKDIYEDYKRRYYLALEYGNSDIPVLEAQISFIRNMFFVVLFSCVVVCCKGEEFCIPSYCVVASLLLIDVIAAFYMFSIQKKIYSHVYEDTCYMEKVKEDEKNGGDNTQQVKEAKALMSKSPVCHLLVMAVLGFVVLFSIAGIASEDGVTYVTGIFGKRGELVFPRYVCIFAASYFVGEVVHIISYLLFVLLLEKITKREKRPSDTHRCLDLENVLSSLGSILIMIAFGLWAVWRYLNIISNSDVDILILQKFKFVKVVLIVLLVLSIAAIAYVKYKIHRSNNQDPDKAKTITKGQTEATNEQTKN